MEALPLPFFRDVSRLPAPLPTNAEIQASPNILKGAGDSIVAVGHHFLVKYGRGARRIEGDNLEADGKLYIVMELVAGKPLEVLWPGLSRDERTLVLGKLRGIFDEMRGLPSPGFFGSVTGGKVPDRLFWTAGGDRKVNGPFATGRDLLLGLAESSRQNWALNRRHSYRADFYERNLCHALGHHAPTFTHTDLLRQNVMVSAVPAPDDAGPLDFRVTVVDWEDAGWYPAYWEYAAAFASFIWYEDDWLEVIESIVDPLCAEATMLKLIVDDLWIVI
ncbi:MAG: hypothetical protein M1829_002122 [Trizodia sp. TS-e1964]|nr:MAG: hypothetical protein M1829_002122 [Trizodia sp. TS-e1964]